MFGPPYKSYHLGVPNCTRLFHGWTPHTQGAEAEVEKNRNMLLIPITDYGSMMAKYLQPKFISQSQIDIPVKFLKTLCSSL